LVKISTALEKERGTTVAIAAMQVLLEKSFKAEE